jgi:ABC-type methionine transport system ATPase subunit
MAVRARADILLIDEVLAVGDADFQRKCFNYFNTLKKAKKTVVFVSHNMDAIREYCDRALLIEKSKVVKIGSTDAISEQYLRLFMGESVSLSSAEPQEQNRWGDHAIRVVDISSKVTGKTVTIRETIKAKQDIEHPIAGFRIRDAAGNDVAGTNTKVENKRLPDFKKGEVAVITWELPNFLRDGQYSIDPAILHSDEVTVADWWNDAAYFEVKKDRHLPYPTDPGFAVSVKMDGQ